MIHHWFMQWFGLSSCNMELSWIKDFKFEFEFDLSPNCAYIPINTFEIKLWSAQFDCQINGEITKLNVT